MIKRYLITTAEERTWVFDKPALFLGEWCRIYDRKKVWEKMDAVVANPYGITQEKKDSDLYYAQQVFCQLLEDVSKELNNFHNCNHSVRFWHILLGHWLWKYTMTIFNRYHTIEKVLQEYTISETTVIKADDFSLATNTSMDFVYACNSPLWNNILFGRILSFFNYSAINYLDVLVTDANKTVLSKEKSFISFVANKVLPKFSSDNDAFIINSYLSKKEDVKLHVHLRQFPQLWRTPKLKVSDFILSNRQEFRINTYGYIGFELFVREQLRFCLPICYLEGYKSLLKQASQLPWPKSPKFIFTSNNFDTDELFKIWTAQHTENFVPYYVGQHGNNYGTYKESLFTPELENCDKFFTWGWVDEPKKHISAFCFKDISSRVIKPLRSGGLLLVEEHLQHQTRTFDIYPEHIHHQNDQFAFVLKLPLNIQKLLTVRLHGGWRNTDWSDKSRWIDFNPSICLELGYEKIINLLKKSRLVVHAYDSTGMLETLAINFPTIGFFANGLDHLQPKARHYYNILKQAGIIFESAEEAASCVSLNWDNINEWWSSEKIQHARRVFCDEYIKLTKNISVSLKRLLVDANR